MEYTSTTFKAFRYQDIEIYFHKTNELVKIIDDKCDLIITMNVAISLLQQIADKNTVLYFLSAYQDPSKYVKTAIRSQSHIKLYRTKEYVYFSTANLSMSSFSEMTVKFRRTPELDTIVSEILFKLSVVPAFLLK